MGLVCGVVHRLRGPRGACESRVSHGGCEDIEGLPRGSTSVSLLGGGDVGVQGEPCQARLPLVGRGAAQHGASHSWQPKGMQNKPFPSLSVLNLVGISAEKNNQY